MGVLRRVTAAAFVLSLGLAPFGLAAAAAAESEVEPGTTAGVTVSQVGWWWKANDTSGAPPEAAPGTGALPKAPAPANVPAGTVPVSAVVGDAEKVSAIGFAFAAEPGAIVSRFVLALRESGEQGANTGADLETTKVVACPITEFGWSAGTAENWATQPEYDDTACQQGVRKADGIWTFDLTAFAQRWLTDEQVASGSVVLVERVEQPASFQVAFDAVDAENVNQIGARLVSRPGPKAPTAPGSGTDAAAGGDQGGVGDSGTGVSPEVTPDLGGVAPEGAEIGLDGVPGEAPVPVAAPGAPGAATAAGPQQPFLVAPSALEDIPTGVWILAPVVLGLAYLMMLALGPGGEPAAVSRRGVSRALEQWRSSGRAAPEGNSAGGRQ